MKKNLLVSALLLGLILLSPASAENKAGVYCPKDGTGKCNKGSYGPFKSTIKYALKNLNLSKGDWGDVKIAFRSYNEQMRSIKYGIPLKSLENGQFNKKVFLSDHPLQQKLMAKAELLETIFLILNTEQKKKFQMLIGAHQYKMQLNGNANCQGNYCNNKQGMLCQGKICDGKTCTGKMCAHKKCDGKMCQGKAGMQPNCKAPHCQNTIK